MVTSCKKADSEQPGSMKSRRERALRNKECDYRNDGELEEFIDWFLALQRGERRPEPESFAWTQYGGAKPASPPPFVIGEMPNEMTSETHYGGAKRASPPLHVIGVVPNEMTRDEKTRSSAKLVSYQAAVVVKSMARDCRDTVAESTVLERAGVSQACSAEYPRRCAGLSFKGCMLQCSLPTKTPLPIVYPKNNTRINPHGGK